MSQKINDGLTRQQRWLAKPGNLDRHRAAVRLCRQRPEAKKKHLERQKQYAGEHREQEKERAAKWRRDNPDKARASARSNYLKRKQKVAEYNRSYREQNPDKVKLWSRNRKAKERGSSGRISLKRVNELFELQDFKCAACKISLAYAGFQIDHIIPLSKGGIHHDSNIQILCPTCNKRKSDRSMEQFLRILEDEVD